MSGGKWPTMDSNSPSPSPQTQYFFQVLVLRFKIMASAVRAGVWKKGKEEETKDVTSKVSLPHTTEWQFLHTAGWL